MYWPSCDYNIINYNIQLPDIWMFDSFEYLNAMQVIVKMMKNKNNNLHVSLCLYAYKFQNAHAYICSIQKTLFILETE